MPSEIAVNADPILVYGMVGLFVGAVVLALIFALPRRALGAATKSDAAHTPPDEAWMPGGDILGREMPPPEPEIPHEPPTYPTFPGAEPPPVPPVHDPWSSSPTEPVGQQPRWDRG